MDSLHSLKNSVAGKAIHLFFATGDSRYSRRGYIAPLLSVPRFDLTGEDLEIIQLSVFVGSPTTPRTFFVAIPSNWLGQTGNPCWCGTRRCV